VKIPRKRSMPNERRAVADPDRQLPSSRVSRSGVRAPATRSATARGLAVRRVPRKALGRVALADLLVRQALPSPPNRSRRSLSRVTGSRSAGQGGRRLLARARSEEKIACGRRVAGVPACSAWASRSHRGGCRSGPGTGARRHVVWPCRHSTSAWLRSACASARRGVAALLPIRPPPERGMTGQSFQMRSKRVETRSSCSDMDTDVVVVEQPPSGLVLAFTANQGAPACLSLSSTHR